MDFLEGWLLIQVGMVLEETVDMEALDKTSARDAVAIFNKSSNRKL
jgi:hypothetical protein